MTINLNIVDVVILVIMALSLISGMYKGFIASGLTTVGFVAAFFGAQSFYPQLSSLIQGNASLMNVLTYYLDASSLFPTVGLAENTVVGSVQNGLLLQAVADLKSIRLPDAVINAFQTNVDKQLFARMGFSTFADYLNQTIWASVINVVSFLIIFALAYVAVLLVVSLLNNVFHFPLLRHFDWLLGGAFGLVRGAVVVALVLAVVPLAMSMVNLDVVDALIGQSYLANYFPKDFAVADIILRAFS